MSDQQDHIWRAESAFYWDVLLDGDKPSRKAVKECRLCYYRGARIAGQAFTPWRCKVCKQEFNYHNTATPRVCTDCAGDELCVRCAQPQDWSPDKDKN